MEISPITTKGITSCTPEIKSTNHEKLYSIDKQITEIPNVSIGRDLVQKVNIIHAGDKILDSAYRAETKGGSATFTLAKGDEIFPNIWDSAGGNYTPNKGDIILGYGEVPKDWGISNPNVLEEMAEKGLETYPDRAVSAEPQLMYETYLGKDGRDFLIQPLKEGEIIAAEKKIFPSNFLFAKPGTMVETLEAKNGAGALAKVGDFQFIQIDAKGNPYVKDVKDLIKRLNPTDEESREIFAKIKELISIRSDILKQIEDGSISKERADILLSKTWSDSLPLLIKIYNEA